MSGGEVSTIFVTGLAMDAQPRELENMMRFCVPGYEGMKPAGAKGAGKSSTAMFVKFDNSDNAVTAMEILNNQPFNLKFPEQLMRVEMARSDMKAPAAANQGTAIAGPPQKRQRTDEDPGSVDTVAVFGAIDKGFTEDQMEEYFGQLPGFICFKGNKRVGGCFVKFVSPAHAQDAIDAAVQSGLEATMARTSMSSPGGDHGPGLGQEHQVPAYSEKGSKGGKGGKGGKKGSDADGPSVDTLILQGVMDKGWTPAMLTDLFQTIPGFVIFKENPRIRGGFVKFTDPQSAMDAIATALESGIEAQMARSSMSG